MQTGYFWAQPGQAVLVNVSSIKSCIWIALSFWRDHKTVNKSLPSLNLFDTPYLLLKEGCQMGPSYGWWDSDKLLLVIPLNSQGKLKLKLMSNLTNSDGYWRYTLLETPLASEPPEGILDEVAEYTEGWNSYWSQGLPDLCPIKLEAKKGLQPLMDKFLGIASWCPASPHMTLLFF